MAVGYHKINTSAARGARRSSPRNEASITITNSGQKFSHPIYGDIETLEPFVSDRDNVRCISAKGELILSGGFVREWLKISIAKNTNN